jgi:hypothetical protein
MSPDNFPFEIHPDLKKQLKTQQDNFVERLQAGLNSLFTFEQAGNLARKKQYQVRIWLTAETSVGRW